MSSLTVKNGIYCSLLRSQAPTDRVFLPALIRNRCSSGVVEASTSLNVVVLAEIINLFHFAFYRIQANIFLAVTVITFRIFDGGSKTEFTNSSLKTQKIGKLNIDTLITPQVLMIHEKNPDQQAHATVPLKRSLLLFSKK